MTESQKITKLLGALKEGDEGSWEQVAAVLYEPLHRIARGQLNRPLPGDTFSPTVLVHELYLKLVDQKQVEWRDREHFFAAAATAMRHIIVDYARRKRAEKRGGGAPHTQIDGSQLGAVSPAVDLLALDEALDKLAALDSRLSRTVELRFFGGLTVEEAAQVLGVAPRTVKSDWRKAKALLVRFLSPGTD